MFDQILDLVGQPPGSLVYHFVILFAIEASLAIGIGQWMRERSQGTARLTIAILTMFLARALVLVASLLVWGGYLPSNVLLPPIERAVDTITVLALLWAFVTMDDPELLQRNFIPDVVAAVILGMTVAGFIGTYYYWFFAASRGQLFNNGWLDILWSTAQIMLAIVGIVWMLTRVRYVYDPFLKVFILMILGGAAAVHLVRPVLGDVAAAVRVGQIIAVPMLASVAYRHVVEKLLHWDQFVPSQPASAAAAVKVEEVSPVIAPPLVPPPGTLEPTRPVEPIVVKPKVPSQPALLDVVEALGGLVSTLDQEQIIKEASRVAATALRADICVLAVIDEEEQQAGILGGYDNIAQNYLPQAVLDLGMHPSIVNALGRLRQMRLTTQRNLRELRDLYSKLGITHQGPAYLQPLVEKQDRIGVLIVGSPYSERQLSNEERNLLDRLGPLVTSALLNAERHQKALEESEQTMMDEGARLASLADELTARTTELDSAHRQMSEMKSYIRDMHRQLEGTRSQLEEVEALRVEIDKLEAEAETLKAEKDRLGREREELSAQGRPASPQAEEEVQRLREDNERLLQKVLQYKYEVEQYQQRAQSLEAQTPPPPPPPPSTTTTTTTVPPHEQVALQRELEETRMALQNELISLRAKLTQASIGQQEVNFLQEQLALKARESITLQARLTEAQAVVDALRDQVGSSLSGARGLESLQARVAEQANEIVLLNERLAEARASAALAPEALRAQQDMDRFDRETTAQLEAQLTERKALAEALEGQLTEKTRAIAELRSHMGDVEASLHNLERQLSHKTEEVAKLQKSLAEARAQAQEQIAALQTGVSVEGDEALQAHVAGLEAELAEKSAAIGVLETQLQNATEAIAAFEQQLSATHQAVDAAISDARQGDGHDEVLASIAQELRTPMSSIMGYTELLLRESVGILGSLQRKFLQRVKANTERMGVLLDDLIRITALDTGRLQLEPEKVDVIYAVEETIMNVANQFRGKGITLRMALAEGLPPLTADRDAVLQVLGHLLTNAALASPVEGEVQLLITMRKDKVPAGDGSEADTHCLYIAVEDSGSGIAPEDFDRVFMRKYRADNPLIDGLGDTGVSLSLAKALIDEHHGRIWLESRQDAGTTFHVLLPLMPPRGESS